MDPITIALMGGTALASIFGASKQASAAKQAAQTQADSSAASLAMQERIYNQQRSDNQPRLQTGNAALAALSARYGLPAQPTAANASYGAPTAGLTYGGSTPQGISDGARYMQDNPDVAAEYARLSPGYLKSAYGVDNPEEFAALHYQSHGPGEGRTWGSQEQPMASGVLDMTPVPSQAGGAPTYAYDPTVSQTGGYEVQARKDVAPLDVSASAYQASPGYDYRVSQGLKAVNAGMSAGGNLGSGRRMMALQDRGDQLANQDYGDWRSYTTGQYNTDRARGDALYAADRGYTADRYDTNTNGLTSLAGLGTQATAANQSAASNFANAYGDATQAGAQANAAGQINAANAWSNGLNNVAQTGAYLYGQGAFGGSKSPGYGSSTYAPKVADAYSGVY